MAGNQELEQAKGNVEEAAENLQQEVQTDIEKMTTAIEQLKVAGTDLFAEEIKNLQIKIENAKAEAAAAVDRAVDDAKVAEQNFVQKYGAGITRAVGIALLVLIASRVFGVI
ncbi:hypothetical protein [Pectinatus frisingensis]|uniref:hypothetical protein n=1 Tax=Pectinatus frisingensis TaxID=865 RepID=UPI0018C6D2C9|nr:hypothetical protein [Pectinatus frisingensis]